MSEQQTTANENQSAPTTPGQAEGTQNPDQQSQPSPSPTQPDQADGEDDEAASNKASSG